MDHKPNTTLHRNQNGSIIIINIEIDDPMDSDNDYLI